MALLKHATLRMKTSDHWLLEYFGAIIIKNGIEKHRSIKQDATNIGDSYFIFERQDNWARIQCIEGLAIATRGLANAI